MDLLSFFAYPLLACILLVRKFVGAGIFGLLFRMLRGARTSLGQFVQAEGREGNGSRARPKGKGRRGLHYFPLGRSTAIYLLVLAVYLPVKAALFSAEPSHWVALAVIHLLAGFVLSQLVLSKVIWHDIYNTLSALAKAKFIALVGWPLTYPALFIQYFVVRYL